MNDTKTTYNMAGRAIQYYIKTRKIITVKNTDPLNVEAPHMFPPNYKYLTLAIAINLHL